MCFSNPRLSGALIVACVACLRWINLSFIRFISELWTWRSLEECSVVAGISARPHFMFFSPHEGSSGIKTKVFLDWRSGFLCVFVEIPPDNHRTNLIKSDHLAGPSSLPMMLATFSPQTNLQRVFFFFQPSRDFESLCICLRWWWRQRWWWRRRRCL